MDYVRDYEIKEIHLKDVSKEKTIENLKDEFLLNSFASFMLSIGQEIMNGRQLKIYHIQKQIDEKETKDGSVMSLRYFGLITECIKKNKKGNRLLCVKDSNKIKIKKQRKRE